MLYMSFTDSGICYCAPYEMWQLIRDEDIAEVIHSLTDKQKEVLYLCAVRRYTPVKAAKILEVTDRAVRKQYAFTLKSIHDGLFLKLDERINRGERIYGDKEEFYNEHIKKINAK